MLIIKPHTRAVINAHIRAIYTRKNKTQTIPYKRHIKEQLKTRLIEDQVRLLRAVLRDGPLEKLWGGRGIFELQEFFFVIKFLV